MPSQKSRIFTIFAIGMLIAVLALTLSACGGSQPTEAPAAEPTPAPAEPAAEEPAAEEPATEEPAAEEPAAEEEEPMSAAEAYEGELSMAIWGQIDSDPQHSAYSYHEILQQWNEMYPNIDLKYELIGGASVPERFTWIKTHMLAGTLPDVVMIYFPGDDYKDPELVYDFAEDMEQPNPYSDNATWWEDFPQDAQLLREWGGADGETYFVGPTLTGDTGVTTFLYNKDIFDEVGVEPPETWAEFMDVQQKIKDAGYTPFNQPMAGPLGWLIDWPIYAFVDQLMDDVIRECDTDEPFDNISQKEMTRCIKTGKFRADDPRFMESWQIVKDWSPMWQEGFLAPPAEGDPWVQGEVAMKHMMNLWIGRVAGNPDIDFEWGTFYQPPLTTETSDLVDEVFIRRVGNTGAAASGSQFLMIPATTVEDGKLDVAKDLVQYTTAPEQLQYWCDHQPVPCFEPGTTIEEVYPDQPETWQRMRGFFEPGAFKNGIRAFYLHTLGQDVGALTSKLLQDYMGDALTLEEAMEELQVIMDEDVEKLIREHPEWNADEW